MRSATGQVARPIFFATLIIISAYFPLFTLQRGEAALFTPMAFTVGYALFGALLCTLGIIPGLAYLAFRKPRPTFQNKPLVWLTRGYRAALGGLLNWPILAYGAVLGLSSRSAFSASWSAGTILPDLDEGALWLQVQMPSGMSLEFGEPNGERVAARRARIPRSEIHHDAARPRGCRRRCHGPLRISRRRSD